jgi:hypothetical protein
MDNVAKNFPWVLVAILLIANVVQYRSVDTTPTETEVSPPVEEIVDPAERIADANPELTEHLEALRIENESLRETVSTQAEELDALTESLKEAALQVTDSQAPETDAALHAEEDRQAISEQMAKMQLERRYGAFIASLGLDPLKEEEVRAALLRVLINASSDPRTSKDYVASWIRDELGQLLSPKKLAEFDAYEEALPEQMLRQSYGSQVDSLAAGLSEATRAMLVDVLVAETLHAEQIPIPEDASAAYQLEQRMNVYANTADRFEGVLGERESAALNRFLNQQYAQLESTVNEIHRAEEMGANINVDMQDGAVLIEINQSE